MATNKTNGEQQKQIESEQKDEIEAAKRGSLELVQFKNERWRLRLDRKVTLKDLERPELYRIVSDRLRPLDIIEAIGKDFWAEVLIIDAERGFQVTARIIKSISLPVILKNDRESVPAGFEIRYDPAQNIYQAFRLSEGREVAMTDIHTNYEDCRRELADHASLRQ